MHSSFISAFSREQIRINNVMCSNASGLIPGNTMQR